MATQSVSKEVRHVVPDALEANASEDNARYRGDGRQKRSHTQDRRQKMPVRPDHGKTPQSASEDAANDRCRCNKLDGVLDRPHQDHAA